jgi:hypothetical protein
MDQLLPIFWNIPTAEVLEQLGSAPPGLSTAHAERVLARYGPNTLRSTQRLSGLRLLLKQFQSPITLILIGAAILSLFLGDHTNASIILVIVRSCVRKAQQHGEDTPLDHPRAGGYCCQRLGLWIDALAIRHRCDARHAGVRASARWPNDLQHA